MTAPYYTDDLVTIFQGNCLDVLPTLPDHSVDAVVTDPPYGLGFMGKAWDSTFVGADMPMRRHGALDSVNAGASRQGGRQRASEDYARRQARDSRAYGEWCERWAAECLRVLKPGGHLLAFGGTRTYHRIACAVEDVGFEMRDSIAWLYGSGFPKSLDVSKAIDKAAGAVRPDLGESPTHHGGGTNNVFAQDDWTKENFAKRARLTAPATDDAQTWSGWGTALKPAHEPILVGRKSLVGTVAANVLTHGTGALNIDACRIAGEVPETQGGLTSGGIMGGSTGARRDRFIPNDSGRWPSNVLLDESQAAELDRQTGTLTSGANPTRRSSDKFRNAYGDFTGQEECTPARGADTGGASRFFPTFRYEAKAGQAERPTADGTVHPTVKPLDLMRWLVRLVTPSGGVVLEPFLGSGTTAEACVIEGFRCIGIEREADYLPLAVARLSKPIQPDMFGAVS